MNITAQTTIDNLLTSYPFLEDFLISEYPQLKMLKNKIVRSTIAKVATLEAASKMSGIDLDKLISTISERILATPVSINREKVDALKSIISFLHDGGSIEEAKSRFNKTVGDVDAKEIAAMEEEMIREGLPVSEVTRLCDVHVSAFKQALDTNKPLDVKPGHPVHTFLEDNKVIQKLIQELSKIANEKLKDNWVNNANKILSQLQHFDNHYIRKENQLFSVLERHNITGPTKVMWGVHNQIRDAYKALIKIVQLSDEIGFIKEAPALSKSLEEMIYKEEKILFPLAIENLSDAEWSEIRQGEDVLTYGFYTPTVPFGNANIRKHQQAVPGMGIQLGTGVLSPEQIDLMLRILPLDISFVDENDTVVYYSDSLDRIFPRSPAVIGRKVQNCHPHDSVAVVQKILDSFRKGEKSIAEFWIQMQGKFILIRYFAMRDSTNAYRGCLEVSQEVGAIRELQGERRLLQWESE